MGVSASRETAREIDQSLRRNCIWRTKALGLNNRLRPHEHTLEAGDRLCQPACDPARLSQLRW
jgi:hypothetical protein